MHSDKEYKDCLINEALISFINPDDKTPKELLHAIIQWNSEVAIYFDREERAEENGERDKS